MGNCFKSEEGNGQKDGGKKLSTSDKKAQEGGETKEVRRSDIVSSLVDEI